MEDKSQKTKEESIVKSNNFEKRFSELEKISERAKDFYIKNDANRRVQESNCKEICDS